MEMAGIDVAGLSVVVVVVVAAAEGGGGGLLPSVALMAAPGLLAAPKVKVDVPGAVDPPVGVVRSPNFKGPGVLVVEKFLIKFNLNYQGE